MARNAIRGQGSTEICRVRLAIVAGTIPLKNQIAGRLTDPEKVGDLVQGDPLWLLDEAGYARNAKHAVKHPVPID